MRLFIAVELEETLREKIYKLQQELKDTNCDIKWVEKDNLHFTLKFLGEIENSLLENIKSVTKTVATKTKKITIGISGIGIFPDTKFARVLWLGITKGAQELKSLAELLDSQLSKLGFKKETREFMPHLTIGRFRSRKNIEKLLDLIYSAKTNSLKTTLSAMMRTSKGIEFGEIEVQNITIFESRLTPKGPIYSIIDRYPLD